MQDWAPQKRYLWHMERIKITNSISVFSALSTYLYEFELFQGGLLTGKVNQLINY